MKTIALLSGSQRTGKTRIAINMALYLVKRGKKVCLLELDFKNPSLNFYFDLPPSWLNDYFFSKKNLESTIQKVDLESFNTIGSLFIGQANPSTQEVELWNNSNLSFQFTFSKLLYDCKQKMEKEPFKIDYLIFDFSVGLPINPLYRTWSRLVDISIVPIKISITDIKIIKDFIPSLFIRVKKNIYLLPNLVPYIYIKDEKIANLIINQIITVTLESRIKLLPSIPYDSILDIFGFEEVLSTDKNKNNSAINFYLYKNDCDFIKFLEISINTLLKYI